MRILISLLGDLRTSSVVSYEIPPETENGKKDSTNEPNVIRSFTSIVPMIRAFKPDEVILLVPNSLLTYLPATGYENSKYEDIEKRLVEHFRKNVKNQNFDQAIFDVLTEENAGKEPRLIVVPTIGSYPSRENGYVLSMKSSPENIISEITYKLWKVLVEDVQKFIRNAEDSVLTIHLDLTHGFNYLQFFLNKAVRDIARILALVSLSTIKSKPKRVSLLTSTFSPFVGAGAAQKFIRVEEIKDVSRLITSELFELSRSPSGNHRIINDPRNLDREFVKKVQQLQEYGLLASASISRGLPLHFAYGALKLKLLGYKELVDELFRRSVEMTDIKVIGNLIEISQNLAFTPLFYNVVRTLSILDILEQIRPEIFEGVINGSKRYEFIPSKYELTQSDELFVELGVLLDVSSVLWNNTKVKTQTAHAVRKELNEIRKQLITRNGSLESDREVPGQIRQSEFDVENVFKLPNEASDFWRNFYAHAGLSSGTFTYVKRSITTVEDKLERYLIYIHPLKFVSQKQNNETSNLRNSQKIELFNEILNGTF